MGIKKLQVNIQIEYWIGVLVIKKEIIIIKKIIYKVNILFLFFNFYF